jgi:RND family efflux transporter MFP subunit
MKRYLVILATLILMLLSACSQKKEEGKSMEQIYGEEGVPVRQTIVEPTTFRQNLLYNATLSGMEETTVQAMVSEVISKINAKVGDRVVKDQIIVCFPQNTPSAQYEQALTAFNSIKNTYERMKRLFNQGAISQQDLDNIETQYKVSKANLDMSDKMINVRAPISGVITSMYVNPSEKVFPGKDLFTVASTNGYKAIIMVPDTEISKVKKGARATATWLDTSINGKVTEVSLSMDNATKAFRVEVSFPGMNKKINYGVTAEISVDVFSKPNVIVVERQHIVNENGAQYVWLNQDNKAVKKEITTGLDNSITFEVTSGLNPGDILITEGINMLTDGAKLRVIE